MMTDGCVRLKNTSQGIWLATAVEGDSFGEMISRQLIERGMRSARDQRSLAQKASDLGRAPTVKAGEFHALIAEPLNGRESARQIALALVPNGEQLEGNGNRPRGRQR